MSLNALQRRLELADLEQCMKMQDQRQLTEYLETLEEEVADYGPSRYNYLNNLLEEEFEAAYHNFLNAGIITFELINLCEHCDPVFLEFAYPANEDSRLLHYAITGAIAAYLQQEEGDGL
jgi:hypothetical protein